MTDLTPTHYPKPSLAYSATGELTVELAKVLALVAPTSMTTEQQELWLRAAVDALEGIRADEVKAISAELRRSVTRHNQIVPEIARLVSVKRASAHRVAEPISPYAAERAINAEAQHRRAEARGDRQKIEEAAQWERNARLDANLHVSPPEKPLSRDELDNMPKEMVALGLKLGFLRRDESGLLMEKAP